MLIPAKSKFGLELVLGLLADKLTLIPQQNGAFPECSQKEFQ